ncbi:hypothetical protein ACOKM5_24185 [Streptomyces sp. BH097]|uniref:hypothetical protein n=1 Tax=Streptomyces sp. BH097 TaxID=3410406 RepID=UPI003CEA820D
MPQDVLDRIASLERQVRELTGRANIRPALNQILNGDVQIGEGGQLIVKAPGGVQHFMVGQLGTRYDEREFGVIIRRRDGTTALSIFNGDDAENPQVLRLLDTNGNGLLVEDIKAGGLYRPWFPYPELANDNTSTWPSTTGTTWTVVEQGNGISQHPRVKALISKANDGNIRLLIDDQVVATSSSLIDTTVDVPNYEFGKQINFKVEARAATASGTVRAKTRYLYGVGSDG